MSIDLLFWIVAAVCFLLAGIKVGVSRVDLIGIGLFFAALTFIL